MAIVKNNYVKRGRGQIARVKASLRYIAHRPGKDKERMYRELFGHDGVMDKDQAYRMLMRRRRERSFFDLLSAQTQSGKIHLEIYICGRLRRRPYSIWRKN